MGYRYVKIFEQILESTVWCEPAATRLVWITMLCMADRDGVVLSSVPGLAGRAKVTVDEVAQALGRFLQPDRYSRTKENEGRRIEEIDGGWRLLNHGKYRDLMSAEAERERKRNWWAENRGKGAQPPSAPSGPSTNLAQASSSTEAVTTTPPSPPAGGGSVDKSKAPSKAPGGQWWRSEATTAAKGRELGMEPRTGESWQQYAERLRVEVAERKRRAKPPDPAPAPTPPAPPPPPVPEAQLHTMPGAWTPGFSLVTAAQEAQPTWTSDHVSDMAEVFRAESKGRTAADWDDAFLDWVAQQQPLPPPVQPAAKRGNGRHAPPPDESPWWDDSDQVLAMAAELDVHSIANQPFEEFRLRVIAASGPGPWYDAQADEDRGKIDHYVRDGINPPPPRSERPEPVPRR